MVKELQIEGIILNLSGMFDQVNQKVGEIAVDIGTTTAGWHSGIFSIIRNLSETVILPIAGVILAFVMTDEQIQIVIDRNNLHEIDIWIFFKWIFKTFIAVMLITNTFNIVMGIFDMSQSVVSSASGIIVSDTAVDMVDVVVDLEARLQAMEVGPLLGLWFQSLIVGLTINVLSICIFLVIYGRMIENYLVTSIGPIPMATLANREWGSIGQNYLRSLLALSFQDFLIIICVAIYAVLI